MQFPFETNKDIAKTVLENVKKGQNQTFTLHGSRSETNKSLHIYNNEEELFELELYVNTGTVIVNGSKNRSYCLYGLSKSTIVFKKKINHLLIRDCDDVKIYLNGGTISGIDILKGSNVSVRTPKHNFTNVEHSNLTHLNGTLDDDTLIHITRSMDVFINRENMNINPFSQSQLKLVYKTDDNEERIDIGDLSTSPMNFMDSPKLYLAKQ
uniref:Adenylate cyclase associated protein n=1 Tax=Pithovirus LCPAC302 TaxID=2506593 RepID=A0A481Z7M6_9VIRU|nr:MAG: adenylate cyclase associated protein [Pithovirus LCPAC302]